MVILLYIRNIPNGSTGCILMGAKKFVLVRIICLFILITDLEKSLADSDTSPPHPEVF